MRAILHSSLFHQKGSKQQTKILQNSFAVNFLFNPFKINLFKRRILL